MANNEVTTGRFTKKDFRGVFWRSFTLLGSSTMREWKVLDLICDHAASEKNI